MRIDFQADEMVKIFLVKGLGVIRGKNPPPPGYVGMEIRNLNLPVYLQKNGWEVNNF